MKWNEIENMELGKLQHVINTRSEFDSDEFAMQANIYLDDLRAIKVSGGKILIGFLIRPRGESIVRGETATTAEINERGSLTVDRLSVPRNHRQCLFGFETVNVMDGWQMGVRYAVYREPVNTYFLPHFERVEILAHVRHEDGSSVSFNPYPVVG